MAKERRGVMLSKRLRARVEGARIRLAKLDGQGVLVPGYILTAAHCVEFSTTGGMALDDRYLEKIVHPSCEPFLAQVAAIEPATDIAALAAADNQALPGDSMAFNSFCATVMPIQLRTRPLVIGEPISVHILAHTDEWIEGTAERFGFLGDPPSGAVSFRTRKQIKGGTSGGPVVDDDGLLVGVVSNCSEGQRDCDGWVTFASLALPGWVMGWINRATADDDRLARRAKRHTKKRAGC
jgi:S1-C subfamily serine protease